MSLRLVCFELRHQELALPIGDVRETLTLQPITHVVLTPPCLAGVFSLRGEIVPVIDLGVLLGMPRTVAGSDSRLVVVKHGPTMFAIVVDRLRDLRTIESELEPAPTSLPAEVATLLLGVAATASGTVRVLDIGAIVAAEPLRALSREPSSEEGRPS
jgi:purine-binding chemotaxis protein CheW